MIALFWVLFGIYIALVFSTIAVMLSQNRNPVKSLSWLSVLVLLPGIGLLLYFFFGQSIKNTRMVSRRNKRRLLETDKVNDADSLPEWFTEDHRRMVRLVNSLDNAHFYPLKGEEKYELFNNGRDFFNALFHDIENARKYVNIQFYIVQDDQIGQAFADLLMRKARQGVKVRLIYDYIGSYKARKKFFERLNKNGVEAHAFFRAFFPILANKVNWRNHRKAVIIDGKIAYLGSTNVADRYLRSDEKNLWRDAGIRVTGAPVAGIQRNFAIDWNFMGMPLILDAVEGDDSTLEDASEGAQLITSGPTGRWNNISMVMFEALASAKKRLFIQTPYFLPPEPLLHSLLAAALSGVDVRVMIPRYSDSKMLTWASYSYIEECLQAGVKIYMFDDGMLHSKVVLVDDDFVTLGSANFDFRSFEHNFEENILLYSREINERLARQFYEDMKHCTRIRLKAWKHRNKSQKARESIVRLLSPLL